MIRQQKTETRMKAIEYWPRSRIVKSTGNAFDLSMPGVIDWTPFHKSTPPKRREMTVKPRNQHIELKGSLPPRVPAHLARAKGKK